MHGLHPLIVDLTLITVYAAITTLIFKKLKQPMVLGYLLAGILAGPFFNLVPTVTDRENLNLWADIGVIFLLFSLGLEFSFKKMMAVGKSALITAMLNLFLMLFVGYYVGMLIGWSTTDSFFLGSMISMSSTTIIIKAFDDLNIKKQKFTDLVFGVLVIEDIVGVLLLVLLPTVAVGQGFNGGELGMSVIKLLSFLVLCFVSGTYIVPTILRQLKDFLNDEMLLLFSVALSLSMVYLAVSFGFSSALGAFIMGSILSETGVIHRVEGVIKPLKDFFGAVFFVTVGMMVNPEMFVTYAYPIMVITLVVLCGMVTFSIFGFVVSGQNLKTAVACGFSLAQVGEFAFIIASLGMSLGVLDDFVYPIIVAVSVITTFLTPIMIKSAGKAQKFLEKKLPENWLAYINQNSKINAKATEEDELWRELFKNTFIRIFLFSIILSAILIFVGKWVRPYMLLWLPNWFARGATTAITLLLMAPFLKGLVGWNILLSEKVKVLFNKISFKKAENIEETVEIIEAEPGNTAKKGKFVMPERVKEMLQTNKDKVKSILSKDRMLQIYTDLWFSNRSNRLLLLILTSVRMMVVSFFIVTAVHQFLTENPRVIFVLLLFSILLITRSKWLLKQYVKMESRFLDNLKGDLDEEEEI